MKQALRVGWLYRGSGEVIEDALITWEGSHIVYSGKYREEEAADSNLIHYPRSICVPAFANGHTHISETLIRGLVDDVPLEIWLYDHVWQVEPQMTANDAYVGAQLGIAEMVSSGTVAFVDQFYYSDQIARAVSETGMKAYLHPSIFDNNPETGTIEAGLKENLRVFDKWNNLEDRIKIGFGPHALYSVPEDTFTEIYHAADERDTWIHTHVSETTTERANALKTWGMSTVKKFNEMGVLDRILPAHGVHMDDEDLQLIADHGLPILHNLGSNLKIGSGIAPVPKMLDLGIPVVLGTDGNASNNDLAVLEEIRLAALIHKGIHQDPTLLPTRTVINMATSNHQAIFGEVYTGTLKHGHPADIAVFNLDTVRSRPVIDPLSNLVYSISPTDCQLTISNGKILYQDGELTSIDLEPLLKKAQSVSERMIADADYKRY